MATWVGYPRSWTRGRNRPIQYVVIHTTEGGEGPTSAEAGAVYDKRRTDGTSTHLFVDSDSAVQEVPFGDRAHAARFHGNEIGVQIELCGTAHQSWAQWHDGASTAELRLAAKEVAAICERYAIPVRHLTVAETRAAYYNPAGSRPKGICSHHDVTRAYPEDGGTHTDPGPNFPWSEFLDMVRAELMEDEDMTPEQAEQLKRVDTATNDTWDVLIALAAGKDTASNITDRDGVIDLRPFYDRVAKSVIALGTTAVADAAAKGASAGAQAGIAAAGIATEAEVRDAVADGLEGGAAAVRADA